MPKKQEKSVFAVFKPLASLRLGVFIMVAMAVISAVGTFYESLYNAEYAKLVVYQSYWMFGIQVLLAVNLAAVMVDRLPWKPRHLPFLLAHVGIIVLLGGSVMTYLYGVDGVMVFPLGGVNQYVQVAAKELSIHSSTDGNEFPQLMSVPVDFYKSNPRKNKVVFNEGTYSEVQVLDHYLFAEGKETILTSKNKADGPALRFFIEGSRARESSWLLANKIFKEDAKAMGPANVKLALKKPKADYKASNEIIFYPRDGGSDKNVGYVLFNRSGKSEGSLEVGEVLKTGWMDFNLRVLSYKPHAYRGIVFEEIDRPHALSTEAVKVKFSGKEYWLGLNQPLKIFQKDRVYILRYAKQRVDIGFRMNLKSFKVGRYQGSMQAASYESLVEFEGKEQIISMNEPLKKNGLTFYQSSFQEDEMGNPTHSVLSVNKDPGRIVKYFGCILIGLGIMFLFYFRRIGHTWRFFK